MLLLETNTHVELIINYADSIARQTIGELPDWSSRRLATDNRLESRNDGTFDLKYVFTGDFGDGDQIMITFTEFGPDNGAGKLVPELAMFQLAEVHLVRERMTHQRTYLFDDYTERFRRVAGVNEVDGTHL